MGDMKGENVLIKYYLKKYIVNSAKMYLFDGREMNY